MTRKSQRKPTTDAPGELDDTEPPAAPATPPPPAVVPKAPAATADPGERKPANAWLEADIVGLKVKEAGLFRAMHAAADVAHGWSAHVRDAHRPMRVTRTDYDLALKAVAANTRHPAATSKHEPVARAKAMLAETSANKKG